MHNDGIALVAGEIVSMMSIVDMIFAYDQCTTASPTLPIVPTRRESGWKSVVTRVPRNPGNFHQAVVGASMCGRTRKSGASRVNLDIIRQMIEEAHAVEVTHRARFAFLKIQVHAARGEGQLIRKR
jgi:hypothetical protein